MDKKKIILDVDTGSDDAIAIMTAVLSDELDVLGITTVNGNRPVMNTTENTLRVLDLLRSDIPVYRGCEEPMVAGLMPERQLFRKTNDKKELGGKTVTYHYEFLEALNDSDGDITIIAVGPLTNLGVAMRADPGIINKIKKLIIMGGGCRQTNTTSAAEFNIWKDPEAAQIVLTSGCEILLVPLDATHRAYVGSEESMKFRQMGTPVGIATADLLDARIQAYDLMQPIECAPYGSTPPHDALAVCAAIDETVLRDVRLCRVDVDCGGSWADGMTIVDPRVLTDQPENVHVAFNADREKFVSMLFDILGKKNQEDR